jgi:hypothetical protein
VEIYNTPQVLGERVRDSFQLARPKAYRNRVIKTLNFEKDIFSEFEELCKEENVYPSHKLQKLMIGELEKRALGERTPIKIAYRKGEKNKSVQMDLGFWLEHVSNVDNQKELTEIVTFTHVINRRASKRSMELYWKGIKE